VEGGRWGRFPDDPEKDIRRVETTEDYWSKVETMRKHLGAQVYENVDSDPGTGNEECIFTDKMIGTPAGRARHFGQLLTKNRCLGMIEQYEETRGVAFDYVVVSRPDAGWLAPIHPHCAYKHRDALYTDVKDWFFLGARYPTSIAMGHLREFERCQGEAWWKGCFEILLKRGAQMYNALELTPEPPIALTKNVCPLPEEFCRKIENTNMTLFCGKINAMCNHLWDISINEKTRILETRANTSLHFKYSLSRMGLDVHMEPI